MESLGLEAFHRILTFTGSRSITNKHSVYAVLDKIVQRYETMGILKQDQLWITGGASGIDTIVANYALESCIPFTIIPAIWDKYGKRAGILRNIVMVDLCSVVVGFWDGKSPGTKQCLDYARSKNKQVHCFTMNKKKEK